MRRPGGSRDLVVVLVAAVVMLALAGISTVVAPPDEGLGVRGSSLSSGAAGAPGQTGRVTGRFIVPRRSGG